MSSNNAYLHADSTPQHPKLILESKMSGGLSYTHRLYAKRTEGILSFTFDEEEQGTKVHATIESLIDSDLLTSEDALRGSLFSRLESFMKFIKTPIKPELYKK